jgi:hypothetical protein
VTQRFELVHLALPPGLKPGEGLGAKVLLSYRGEQLLRGDSLLGELVPHRIRRLPPSEISLEPLEAVDQCECQRPVTIHSRSAPGDASISHRPPTCAPRPRVDVSSGEMRVVRAVPEVDEPGNRRDELER